MDRYGSNISSKNFEGSDDTINFTDLEDNYLAASTMTRQQIEEVFDDIRSRKMEMPQEKNVFEKAVENQNPHKEEIPISDADSTLNMSEEDAEETEKLDDIIKATLGVFEAPEKKEPVIRRPVFEIPVKEEAVPEIKAEDYSQIETFELDEEMKAMLNDVMNIVDNENKADIFKGAIINDEEPEIYVPEFNKPAESETEEEKVEFINPDFRTAPPHLSLNDMISGYNKEHGIEDYEKEIEKDFSLVYDHFNTIHIDTGEQLRKEIRHDELKEETFGYAAGKPEVREIKVRENTSDNDFMSKTGNIEEDIAELFK